MLCTCGCLKEVTEGKRFVQGHGNKGRKFSDEHRKKISIANTGHERSEETRQKMREKMLGKKHSVETKKKIGDASRGRKHSDEQRQKISERQEGQKRSKLSEGVRQKISEALKGRKFSDVHRQKISDANKGRQHSNKGQKFSEEHRKKIGDASRGRKHSDMWKKKISESKCGRNIGSENPNWKGGSDEHRGADWPKTRLVVLARDQFTCQRCRVLDRKAHVHHIIPYRLVKSNDPENLISLCSRCHKFVEHMFEREFKKSGFDVQEFRTFWMKVYREVMK